MMLGQVVDASSLAEDFEASSLAEAPKPAWHMGCNMSPSLSSATTTDEEFPFGSPKQRWADLSDEDDEDLFSPERNPFGCLTTDEGKDEARDNMETCADSKIPHGGNNEAHERRGDIGQHSAPKFFNNQQLEFAESDSPLEDGRSRGRSQPHRCPVGNPPFGMLPPSVESYMTNTQTWTRPHVSPAVVAPEKTHTAADIFTVTLSGIPIKLCNETCLDAILWAAGVQTSALEYHTTRNGQLTITFGTLDAATHCVNHFKTCAWTTGKLTVDLVRPDSNRTADGSRRSKQESKSFSGFSQTSRRQPRFAQQRW